MPPNASVSRLSLLKSSGWLVTGSVVTTGLGLFSSILLMRVLEPEVFGVLAAFMVVNGLFEMIRDVGLARAIVFADSTGYNSICNLAFFSNLAAGLVFCVVLFFCAPILAGVFGVKDSYVNALRALALLPLANASVGTLDNILQSHMMFREKVIGEIVSASSYMLMANIIALAGFGVWSIVIALLVSPLVLSAWYWSKVMKLWIPSLRFQGLSLKRNLQLGFSLTGSGLIAYVYNNLDNLAVGKILGPIELGFYSRGYNYAMMPSSLIGSVIGKITGPWFREKSKDPLSLASDVARLFTLLLILSPPLFISIIALSRDLVVLAVGAKWLPMVVPFQILTAYSCMRLIASSSSNVFAALGKYHLISLLPLAHLFCLAIIVFPLTARYGIVGTSVAVFLTIIVGGTASVWAVLHSVHLSIKDLRAPLFFAIAFSGSSLIAIFLLDVQTLSQFWLVTAKLGIILMAFVVFVKWLVPLEAGQAITLLKQVRLS
jgi:lipopolysaccharide exporter